MPAEGLTLSTTTAVLLGIHEVVTTQAAAGAGGGVSGGRGAAATPQLPAQKRVFGHIVSFGTTAEDFAAYEGLAKQLFQSCHAQSPIPATR